MTTGLFRLPAEAVGARRALDLALDALRAAGRTWPCRNDDRFTSELRTERAEAAAACALCPVRRACRAYGQSAQESHHVWGGHDRTPRPPGRPRKATTP
jgi:hypothetical protein